MNDEDIFSSGTLSSLDSSDFANNGYYEKHILKRRGLKDSQVKKFGNLLVKKETILHNTEVRGQLKNLSENKPAIVRNLNVYEANIGFLSAGSIDCSNINRNCDIIDNDQKKIISDDKDIIIIETGKAILTLPKPEQFYKELTIKILTNEKFRILCPYPIEENKLKDNESLYFDNFGICLVLFSYNEKWYVKSLFYPGSN